MGVKIIILFPLRENYTLHPSLSHPSPIVRFVSKIVENKQRQGFVTERQSMARGADFKVESSALVGAGFQC